MNATEAFVDDNVRAGRGDSVAIIDAAIDRELTYRHVLVQVNRTGHALRRLGVRPEERVMLLLPDVPEFAFAFFGAIKIGAVAVPVNTLLKPHDYDYLLNDSRARALIVHARLLPLIESDDDAAFWLYSSGTTGFPKGAIHLQHDMICCAESFARGVLGITPADRTFSVARLFFAYGLGNALYFPFYVGATTILHPGRPEPQLVFDVVARHKPTLFYSVPTSYAAMLAAMDAGTASDFSSVRLCSSAGEPLAASLYERWRARTGVEILDGIGSTEVLHTFLANRPGRVRPGSSGEVVPGYEARIVHVDGRDVPDGEIGDLLIKGKSTCAGYWNRQEQSRRTIIGEWIRTGDKYSRDADGYFWYQGRSDDMLKVSGQWVSPAEVESTLVTHAAVLEAAVVGREDAERLVKPIAFVVLKSGYKASVDLEQELREHVKARLALYKYPRWVVFVDELPKTATGKIQRYRLRALASSPASAPGEPPITT